MRLTWEITHTLIKYLLIISNDKWTTTSDHNPARGDQCTQGGGNQNQQMEDDTTTGNVKVSDITGNNFVDDNILNLQHEVPLVKVKWVDEHADSQMEMPSISQVPNLDKITTLNCPSHFNLMDLKGIYKLFTVQGYPPGLQ
eukprot:7030209-Ditylum_brightwellii.AAC.1